MSDSDRPGRPLNRLTVSRRLFAGVAGVGAMLAVRSELGPEVAREEPSSRLDDLSSPAGRHELLLRLVGSGRGARPRLSWFDGAVHILTPAGSTRVLFGVRGVSSTRVTPGSLRVLHREISSFYDLSTGRRFGAFRNPITGQIVHGAAQFVTSSRVLSLGDPRTPGLLTVQGSSVAFTESFANTPFAIVDLESGGRFRRTMAAQTITHLGGVDGANRQSDGVIKSHGQIVRTVVWPTWLGLNSVHGGGVMQTRFHFLDALDRAPGTITNDLAAIKPSMRARFFPMA